MSNIRIIAGAIAGMWVLFLLASSSRSHKFDTFADYPGFNSYFPPVCSETPATEYDLELLQRFKPRVVIAPQGQIPVDFYQAYLPFTVLKNFSQSAPINKAVSPQLLKTVQYAPGYYLDLNWQRLRQEHIWQKITQQVENNTFHPTLYGRIYHVPITAVMSAGKKIQRQFKFLKYTSVFMVSGLPAKLPWGTETLLKVLGLNPLNWHELDHYTAIHVVLNERDQPIALLLAQHNYHRAYLIGKQIPKPVANRVTVDVAERSNELYPASSSPQPVSHRTASWSRYMKYILSGQDAPFFHGEDITHGIHAGGKEINYELKYLPHCDPFYRAKIMLGEFRPLFGFYVGRDGPPGADYYTMPALLALDKLLFFSYLHENNPEDLKMLDAAWQKGQDHLDEATLIQYGAEKFFRDLSAIE